MAKIRHQKITQILFLKTFKIKISEGKNRGVLYLN
jgi:hypothetical protein